MGTINRIVLRGPSDWRLPASPAPSERSYALPFTVSIDSGPIGGYY